ncbi:MAG: DinB family protein [Chloroflexi bacterium]|nr:DinB family protein [Chloroflexota bacterium]
MDAASPKLAITPYWQSVQDHILQIVDLIPENKLNWTPRQNLWNARGILIHVADARDRWLSRDVQDGEPYPDIWTTARTPADLKTEIIRTFERLQRFLSNQEQLDRTYTNTHNRTETYDGHWIAFHLLEHDIHHRAELLQRLALLDIAHGIDI